MIKKLQKPTDAELEILQILWAEGPSSVRKVNEKLSSIKEVGYTTTLKLMQIMTEKKLVSRDTKSRQHIYQSNIGEQEVQRGALSKIISTAFRGSATGLIMQALGQHSPSSDELAEIKAFIEKMESDQQ